MSEVDDAIERAELIKVLQDAVWPFLAHDPDNPALFWDQMARKIEEHYAVEVKRLRGIHEEIAVEVKRMRELAAELGIVDPRQQ